LNPSEASEQFSIEELCSALRGESIFIKSPDNLPFSELFQPLVSYASKDIGRLAEQHDWLAGTLPGLQTQLYQRLHSVASIPLYLWLHLHEQSPDRSASESFIETMKSATDAIGWPSLLGEYPELGRLLIMIVSHWRAASLEFLHRLVTDRAILEEFLGVSELAVESISAGLSDSHHDGRSVIQVRFQSGLGIAYKPRELAAEAVFARLLGTIEADHPELALPRASVLSRSGYGWMTWLDSTPSTDSSAWYAKAGMLQGLLQILGATDAHMANCIATAVGPALIDCECMPMPSLVNAKDHAGAQSGPEEDPATIKQIVLEIQSTGLLPLLDRPPGEPDLSGLFGRGGQATGYRIPMWTQQNRKSLKLNFRPAVLRAQANLLASGSPQISRMAAGKAFAEGFAKMHNYLERNQSRVLDALSPLDDRSTRVLLRNTRRYTHILSQSIHPRFLRDRNARRELIRVLLEQEEPVLPLASNELRKSILDAEVDALERLDVPLFHSKGRDLLIGERTLATQFFASSGYESAVQRLHALNAKALDKTLNCLRLLWIQTAISSS
jgi:lantibiotic modifying enzyme